MKLLGEITKKENCQNMSEGLQILISVVTSSGILSLIGFLLKKKFSAEIENSIKSRYDLQLEEFKTEMLRDNSILTQSIIAQTEGLKASAQKRLVAIDEYWKSILVLEEASTWVDVIDAFVLKNETDKIKKGNIQMSEKISNAIENAFKTLKINDFVISDNEKKKELELLRPYIGEELWKLRALFLQLVGRVMIYYEFDYNKGKALTHWTEDEFLFKTLNKELTKDELSLIKEATHNSFKNAIIVMKQKILNEISKITSGALVGESSLKNSIVLSDLLDNKRTLPNN